MRNFSSCVDYADSRPLGPPRTIAEQTDREREREREREGERGWLNVGNVRHSRVCGAADKGPSLDNYLPFGRLASVILVEVANTGRTSTPTAPVISSFAPCPPLSNVSRAPGGTSGNRWKASGRTRFFLSSGGSRSSTKLNERGGTNPPLSPFREGSL